MNPMNSDERKKEYDSKLQAVQAARLAAIVPFTPFKEFPSDIRYIIWKLSLPGPRTICPGNPPLPKTWKSSTPNVKEEERYQSDLRALYFPKEHHSPNPAALSVCRESRDIALKTYRLCFGTPNVYADLKIDILYFGPWYFFDMSKFLRWRWYSRYAPGPQTFDPPVKADLELVQRVGINYAKGWRAYEEFGGDRLRKQLVNLKSLREVLLNDGTGMEDSLFWEPGQTVVKKYDVKLQARIDPMYDDWYIGTYADQLRRASEKVLPEFRYRDLSAKEKEFGIPEVKLASFGRVPHMPEPLSGGDSDDHDDKNLEKLEKAATEGL